MKKRATETTLATRLDTYLERHVRCEAALTGVRFAHVVSEVLGWSEIVCETLQRPRLELVPGSCDDFQSFLAPCRSLGMSVCSGSYVILE